MRRKKAATFGSAAVSFGFIRQMIDLIKLVFGGELRVRKRSES
jgi:hypothetical protein